MNDIEKIFKSGKSPAYIAASMFYKSGGKTQCADHTNEELSLEDRYWLSLCYMRFKGNVNKELYNEAMEFVLKYGDDKENARNLLLIGG